MEIKAIDVQKLRKMTGAGMMDCKKALIEANGDYERAKEIIREKGKLVAAKRADRETSEGAVVAKVDGSKGILLCLGCETDFVAKNEEFQTSWLRTRSSRLLQTPSPMQPSRLCPPTWRLSRPAPSLTAAQ